MRGPRLSCLHVATPLFKNDIKPTVWWSNKLEGFLYYCFDSDVNNQHFVWYQWNNTPLSLCCRPKQWLSFVTCLRSRHLLAGEVKLSKARNDMKQLSGGGKWRTRLKMPLISCNILGCLMMIRTKSVVTKICYGHWYNASNYTRCRLFVSEKLLTPSTACPKELFWTRNGIFTSIT